MNIDVPTLVKELESLSRQRQDTLANLARIEGAEKMVRHLLTKASQRPAEGAVEVDAENVPADGRNRIEGLVP